MGARITVAIVFGLVAAAGVGIYVKVPSWDEIGSQIDQLQGELLGEMKAEMPAGFGGFGGADGFDVGDAAGLERVRTAEASGDEVSDGSYSLVELFTEDDAEAALAGRRVMYQFSDDAGSVHFVDRIEQVPAAYRDRVGRIEMGGRNETKTASRTKKRRWPWQKDEPEPAVPAKAAYGAGASQEVVVYMAPWCGACKATMRHLDQMGVDYVVKNIERDQSAAFEALARIGGNSLPLPTVTIGDEVIQGHQPDRLDSLLGA